MPALLRSLTAALVACAACTAPWPSPAPASSVVDVGGPPGQVEAPAEALDLLAAGLVGWVAFPEREELALADLARLEDGVLHVAGDPRGYLATRRWYRDYALELEWRWPVEPGGRGGNSGVLVHATAPYVFYAWPRSLEVQLQAGSAGDFWVIGAGVDVHVPDEATRRAAPKAGDPHTHRRIANLTDGSERPLGAWNHLRIECAGDRVRVWVNGDLVNDGTGCTVTEGAIALQSEGTPVDFRGVRLLPLVDAALEDAPTEAAR